MENKTDEVGNSNSASHRRIEDPVLHLLGDFR